MLQSQDTLIGGRKRTMGTFNLEQHQLTVGEVHHNLPPTRCISMRFATKKTPASPKTVHSSRIPA